MRLHVLRRFLYRNIEGESQNLQTLVWNRKVGWLRGRRSSPFLSHTFTTQSFLPGPWKCVIAFLTEFFSFLFIMNRSTFYSGLFHFVRHYDNFLLSIFFQRLHVSVIFSLGGPVQNEEVFPNLPLACCRSHAAHITDKICTNRVCVAYRSRNMTT